ncbi:DUF4240 domain-containing protein [Actinacidiphila sp. ITFR-21]|uniref:DUF4240 domain-containing protein n=1 Tax=Actinacidiphila sp. ITFR-21 TaxID=3075199 RepID=UPI00288B59B0|nr:DUF4240 domain-containing protein [Streptomyces sp. ITFR-21]WNI16247.1 DUF4240 domain-containing protein [Streptomyces sp. ITFR-21]
METDPFWTLIADCRRRGLSGDQRDAWLRDALLRLPPPDVIAFQACLEQVTGEACTWNLWAAADRVFGGWCSDDTFCHFQFWMVGLGRPVFEAALTDADVLAYAPEVLRLSGCPRAAWTDDAWPQWESLGYLAPSAYEELVGGFDDCGDAFYADVRALRGTPARNPPGLTPAGSRWSVLDEAESARRLPRLTAMFPLGSGSVGQPPLTRRT